MLRRRNRAKFNRGLWCQPDERRGSQHWLKREDLTPVRSYKLRGAFNAMRKVLARDPGQRRFVCASAGTMRRAWPLPAAISA